MIAPLELTSRYFQPSDTAQLVELFAQCYPEETWRPVDFRRFAECEHRDNRLKVLVDEDDVEQRILAAMGYTMNDAGCEGDCRIRRLAVSPDLRRQGFATQLLTSVAGRRSPVQQVNFTAVVPEDNLPAQLFFRDGAAGFRHDPADRRQLPDGRQGYVFRFRKTPRRRRVAAHF